VSEMIASDEVAIELQIHWDMGPFGPSQCLRYNTARTGARKQVVEKDWLWQKKIDRHESVTEHPPRGSSSSLLLPTLPAAECRLQQAREAEVVQFSSENRPHGQSNVRGRVR
jgi:hypothetical protein